MDDLLFTRIRKGVLCSLLIVLAGCGGGETSPGVLSTEPEQHGWTEPALPSGAPSPHAPLPRVFDRAEFDQVAYQGTHDLVRDVEGTYRSIVRVENRHAEATEVLIGIEDLLFIDKEDILESIERMPEQYSDEPDYRKAWRFVAARAYHANPFSERLTQHDPLLYMNSMGAGFCDDVAAVLATIWHWQGHSSRVWGLSGHVVAEIEQNGDWMMFDADYGVIYLDESGKIASAAQLSESPDLVLQPYDPVRPTDHSAYSRSLADLYASIEDNFLLDGIRTDAEHALSLRLPPRSALTFPIPFDEPIIAYDGERIPLLGAGQIEVPAGSEVSLELPFIVLDVQGSGELSVDGVAYEIGSEEADRRLRGDMTTSAGEAMPVTSIALRAGEEMVRVVFGMSPFVTDGAFDARLTLLQRRLDPPVHVSIAHEQDFNDLSPVSQTLADAVQSGWSSPVSLRALLDSL
ncbi:MAG TPA: hypothetical protein VGE10_07710 [Zeimonas sp.]